MYAETHIPSRYEALLAVRESFETQQAMADAFGVSQPTIWRWLNQSKQLPAGFVLIAERLTGVSRHWLRPDIYPAERAGIPATWTMLDDRESVVTYKKTGVSTRHTNLPARFAGAR